MIVRLESRLLALKPGDILFMNKDEYDYMMENAMAVTADIAKREAERDPLLVEREKTHGSFKQNAEIHQRLLGTLKDYDLKDFNAVHRTAMEMICLKIARIMSNPKTKDSWDDIAGYAKLGAEACDER